MSLFVPSSQTDLPSGTKAFPFATSNLPSQPPIEIPSPARKLIKLISPTVVVISLLKSSGNHAGALFLLDHRLRSVASIRVCAGINLSSQVLGSGFVR